MFESWLTLVITTAALIGSPGPAPLALAAVGATAGFKRGSLFLAGILAGLLSAMLGAIFGLAALFNAFPEAKVVCQFVSAGYMVFVAYKIASTTAVAGNGSKIPDFKDGFILNLLNPKAYAAFLAIFSQFLLAADSESLSYIYTGLTCFIVAVIVDTVWLAAGGLLKPIFSKPKQAKAIRIIFALTMLLAVGYVLII